MRLFRSLQWLLPTLMIASSCDAPQDRPIVIIFDNDAHCNIDGYVPLAGLRDAIVASDTAYCATVSSGDFVQGGTVGTLSEGQYVIDVVNAVGYDVMALGNHEFDYGIDRLYELVDHLDKSTLISCANFYSATEAVNQPIFNPYIIKQMGARKVGFIGALTPSAMQSESYAFYSQDGKPQYDLRHDDTYALVQQAVNQARAEGADYIVVLSHLGESRTDITSPGLIAATTGIDVVLDGHSHSVVPCDTIPNLKGEPVILAQTGSKLANVGKLVIGTDGRITTELIPSSQITYSNDRVAAVVDSIHALTAEVTARVCGHNDQLLTVNGPDGKRLVRNGETNLANLIADAIRWKGEAEIGLVNGGGVRTDLPAGDFTYGHLLDVQPFSNELCVALISGSLLWSAIEVSCADLPAENGMIIQPSGLRYVVNVNDEPRVKSVEVLNARGKYEPIDLDREYKVALTTYALSQYNGLFLNCEVVNSDLGVDVEATYDYVAEKLNGRIGPEYAKAQGRIKIQ